MLRKSFIILAFFYTVMTSQSCDYVDADSPNLSGNYWFIMKSKAITLRKWPQYNPIYPVVTDYAYDSNFIIVEQKPDKDDCLVFLGSDLLGRFNNYSAYRKSKLKNDSLYIVHKNFIESDSMLYEKFITAGAKKEESENRKISIKIAENLIRTDEYYKKILRNNVNYWILYHLSDTLIGPLNKQEYLIAKKKIGVPENLKLNFEK